MSKGSDRYTGVLSLCAVVVFGALLGFTMPCHAATCGSAKVTTLDGIFSGNRCVTKTTSSKLTVLNGVYKYFANGERFKGRVEQTVNSDGSSRTYKAGYLLGPTVSATLNSEMAVSASGSVSAYAVLSGTWTVGTRTFEGTLEVTISGTTVTVQDNRI
jgi:hypothetical protein